MPFDKPVRRQRISTWTCCRFGDLGQVVPVPDNEIVSVRWPPVGTCDEYSPHSSLVEFLTFNGPMVDLLVLCHEQRVQPVPTDRVEQVLVLCPQRQIGDSGVSDPQNISDSRERRERSSDMNEVLIHEEIRDFTQSSTSRELRLSPCALDPTSQRSPRPACPQPPRQRYPVLANAVRRSWAHRTRSPGP